MSGSGANYGFDAFLAFVYLLVALCVFFAIAAIFGWAPALYFGAGAFSFAVIRWGWRGRG